MRRQDVFRALALYDELGGEAFRRRFGYGEARRFLLVHDGREYDSKAVVGVAHGFLDGRGPLVPGDFSGGAAHAVRHLRDLGFEVRDRAVSVVEVRDRPAPVVEARDRAAPVVEVRDRPAPVAEARDRAAPVAAEAFLAGLLAVHRDRAAAIALLWAVGRAAEEDRPRLHPWSALDGLGRVLAEHGAAAGPERVCRGLEQPDLWVVEPGGTGFAAPPHDRLRHDVAFRTQAVNALRSRLLDDVEDQRDLLVDLGLDELATASGSVRTASRPGRRERTGSVVARERSVAAAVKRWHDHRCQFCGTRMSTAFGYCSQAAHIRGLGRHGGPDEPANVLCLCANCHVEFDNFALYVDEDGVVRRVRDRSSVGELRRHPEHAVDERHLAYHRELCVIGPPPA